MADDTELGPAVISIAESSNGAGAAVLYQQIDDKMVSIGYLQDGIFAGGPNLTFYTPDALNEERILEYRVQQMQRGSSILLGKLNNGVATLPWAKQGARTSRYPSLQVLWRKQCFANAVQPYHGMFLSMLGRQHFFNVFLVQALCRRPCSCSVSLQRCLSFRMGKWRLYAGVGHMPTVYG